MPSITLKNIQNRVYENLNLKVRDKEFLVVLGPNGSGKSTLLNVIAGLSKYQGTVRFDDRAIDHQPARKRGVGYLFQDLALFPHLDVASNIAYGLKIRKLPKGQVEDRVRELLELVHVTHLESRYPESLSGGEKQRVALARALAASTQILLLDEPMSSLDEQTADLIKIELKQIQRRLGVTTLYVTHDIEEAVTLGDRLAILLDGNIEQVDEPERVLFYPTNKKVADFIGAPNILDCSECNSERGGVMRVDCSILKLTVPHDGNAIHKIAILPRDIYISDSKPKGPGINCFLMNIENIVPLTDRVRIYLRLENTKLLAELPHPIFDSMDLSIGKEAYATLRMKKIRILENNWD